MELTMKRLLAVCWFCLAWLAGCNSGQGDLQRAVEARHRTYVVKDEQAWARAQQLNTMQSYQNYIQDDPSGIHVAEARDHVAASERSSAWTAASMTDTPDVLAAFLEKYPQGPEADQAKARLAQLTGYRVQLASFRSEKQAQTTRDRLQGKYGDVLGSVDIIPGATAEVHVLRSASMGQGEANTACAKLKRDHLTCEVIKDANS
jgi:sporulation related protein